MNNESLSSSIVSDADIIAYIYTIIKNAGIKVVNTEAVKDNKSDVCVAKANTEGVTRFNCSKSKNEYSIHYDANDIMIVGGAALNIYDYLLSDFKTRKEFGKLEQYIKKNTSDIDIVWWPRAVVDIKGNYIDKEIVVAKSEAITELAGAFKYTLQELFNENKEILTEKIKPYVKNIEEDIVINVVMEPMYKLGTWNININFKIKDKEYKLCDVIIHDSGSSQLYDINGNEIKTLQNMMNDPIYCTPRQGHYNSISYLNVNGIDIAVPNIQSFIVQQMLAFNNLIDKKEETKGFINYKRVEYIKKILSSINILDSKNKTDFLEVFKTDNKNHLNLIINGINNIENAIIQRISNKILKLCNPNSIKNDDIIKELCEKLENVKKADNVKREEIAKSIESEIISLKTLKKEIQSKYETAPTEIFKNRYTYLFNQVDNYISQLSSINPNELLGHNILKNKQSSKIKTEVSKIDFDIQKYILDVQLGRVEKKNTSGKKKQTPPPFYSQPQFHQPRPIPLQILREKGPRGETLLSDPDGNLYIINRYGDIEPYSRYRGGGNKTRKNKKRLNKTCKI